MSQEIDKLEERRKVLRMLGQSAVLLPVAGLVGCGGEESPDTSEAVKETMDDMADTMEEAKDTMEGAAEEAMDAGEEAMDDAQDAAEDAMDEAKEAMESAQLPLIEESDPQATALGYVHDATTVDGGTYPRYQSGQACANCALYTGGDAAQGPCGIFAGKAVKATGWCSAYAPAAS